MAIKQEIIDVRDEEDDGSEETANIDISYDLFEQYDNGEISFDELAEKCGSRQNAVALLERYESKVYPRFYAEA